jgi:hypothetical protein
MYFEPTTTKKTYYRFPSASSIQNLDSRYYFPEKPMINDHDLRFEDRVINRVPERDNFYNI